MHVASHRNYKRQIYHWEIVIVSFLSIIIHLNTHTNVQCTNYTVYTQQRVRYAC